jgi:hypothetical protein
MSTALSLLQGFRRDIAKGMSSAQVSDENTENRDWLIVDEPISHPDHSDKTVIAFKYVSEDEGDMRQLAHACRAYTSVKAVLDTFIGSQVDTVNSDATEPSEDLSNMRLNRSYRVHKGTSGHLTGLELSTDELSRLKDYRPFRWPTATTNAAGVPTSQDVRLKSAYLVLEGVDFETLKKSTGTRVLNRPVSKQPPPSEASTKRLPGGSRAR